MSNLTRELIPGLERLEPMVADLENGVETLRAFVASLRADARSGRTKFKDTRCTASGLWTYAGACEFRLQVLLEELEKFRELYHRQDLRAFKGEEDERP